MNFTKKIDRAFQWAGEKMGAEAKTSMSDDFKNLETEMNLRHDGMERLQRSMTAYVKWVGRRGETFDDREKGLPVSYLGRTMINHGEDFEADSEFGNCLTSLGRANERLASAQERYVADATSTWLESLERSLAMMKEYQAARKKLENRRLAYDAIITKMQKTKRDDFRVEEELRATRAKYEESNEDVYRRMQDVKESETESIRDLTGFLDCELEYHERCAEELRRVKRSWPGAATAATASSGAVSNSYGGRSRSNTARSFNTIERTPSYGSTLNRIGHGKDFADEEPEPMPVRMPIRSNSRANSSTNLGSHSPPEKPMRPIPDRNNSLQPPVERSRYGGSGTSTPASSYSNSNSANPAAAAVASLRSGLRPVGRVQTNNSSHGNGHVYGDDADDTTSGGSGSPDYGERSASPATSYDSLSRSTSNVAARKPPPPPPNRSKKPPPPPAPRRETAH
ncbi:bar domain-containing protein [Ophiostoma piceae UAMH 11346]|uniref:Bar domain-containing protein n=1 Tax=Ophiostoma piceae (strain UAMH 11346) TaxID=1262450 RepID=S3CC60_OPHP1|nr:bar domain-containing protein [Ophiostoma piceae UAMH 11346]